ncbi:M20/M25/M40 family metallo-hydrolase, partial [Patescibacteria group bacterium]|nr:M20/M25/M40 family metallo-hydrolase [Patescibacteria group bacterium]
YKVNRLTSTDGINALLVMGSDNPKVVFACHMDTVPPSKSEHTNTTDDGDKIYGLGTKDMKGGCVAALAALSQIKNAKNVGIIFYSDEEYNQRGIKYLCGYFAKNPIKPKLIISPESRFNLGYGARGVLVVDLIVKGVRAHSARPHLGKDAIKSLFVLVKELETMFSETTQLGQTSFTITQINGGVLDSEGNITHHAGSIPDICKATISIRNAIPTLTTQLLIESIEKIATTNGVKVQVISKEDLPTRLVPMELVNRLQSEIEKNLHISIALGDPKTSGYNDADLLAKSLRCQVINFGPYGEDNHTADEWVSLESIKNTAKILICVASSID